jgi:hypothetical protein
MEWRTRAKIYITPLSFGAFQRLSELDRAHVSLIRWNYSRILAGDDRKIIHLARRAAFLTQSSQCVLVLLVHAGLALF